MFALCGVDVEAVSDTTLANAVDVVLVEFLLIFFGKRLLLCGFGRGSWVWQAGRIRLSSRRQDEGRPRARRPKRQIENRKKRGRSRTRTEREPEELHGHLPRVGILQRNDLGATAKSKLLTKIDLWSGTDREDGGRQKIQRKLCAISFILTGKKPSPKVQLKQSTSPFSAHFPHSLPLPFR